MEKIFNSITNKTVLVIGDLMLDKYITGEVSRISPEAPVPVVNVVDEYITLGGAGNVVRNLVDLGCKVIVLGIVGNDYYGKILIDNLKEMNNVISYVLIDDVRPTTIKTRIVADAYQLLRFDIESIDKIPEIFIDRFINYLSNLVSNIDVIVVSDYNKGVITELLMQKIINIFPNAFILSDPQKDNFGVHRGVSLVTPNIMEAETFCGFKLRYTEDFLRAAKYISSSLGIKYVLITKGKYGMALYNNNKLLCDIGTQAKNVYDVSGAGDTVIATIAASVSAGDDLLTACKLANLAAGEVVSKRGTSSITLNKLKILAHHTHEVCDES